MKILLFGGTTEGRVLAEKLTGRGHSVTVCVATDLGAEELEGCPCKVLVGRLEEKAMAAMLPDYDLAVDATHPYAEAVSRNIRDACEETGVPLRRVLRPASDEGDCICFSDNRAAAAWLRGRPGNVLLTVGSKELGCYEELDPARLYPRVLPTHAALEACEALGIPHSHILALQGPFCVELNEAMLRQYDIAYLVTKDGGKAGGFPEKLEAAKRTGATVLLVARPRETGLTPEDLLAELEEWT